MKENKIEKLILDLSNRWECTPQEAVDRLNSMNESEINKLINSMTKKFKKGGLIDCLREGRKLSECKKCAPAEAVSVFGIPSLKYEEVPQNIPVQMNGLQSNLEIGKVRTDNNGAAIFESNFGGVPNQIISTPTNLRIDESVLDRVNRSRNFHNRMQTEGRLTAPKTELASYGSGGSVEKYKCGDKITKHQQTSIIGKQVDGMGLPVQLPNKTKDLKYSNIISNGVTGKAATWISKDGKSQVTEFLMADNNPDVPGYANDVKAEIPRDPITGELGRDTVLRSKILPGIYGIGLPIKYRSDAYVVRNAKKRK